MDEVQKFEALKEKIDTLSQNKIRIEERFKAEKEKLEALIKEIESKGFDPQNLGTLKDRMEKDLGLELQKMDDVINILSDKLSSMEAI